MKQKKETILAVLENGARVDEETKSKYFPFITHATNGTFSASYPTGTEKFIQKDQERLDRIRANRQNYGCDSGKAGVSKPNKTEIVLADLMQHKCHCPKLWAMYQKCLQAPRNLQKIVFENLKYWLSAENKDFSLNFSTKYPVTFDIISCLPPAWIKNWEQEDLHGWDTQSQIEDLIPASGLEIGARVCVPWQGKKGGLFEGKIVGYKYLGEKVSGHGGNYSYTGRKILWYDVQVGENRWNHAPFRLKEISFDFSAAI